MRKIFGAVLAVLFLSSVSAAAQSENDTDCDCAAKVGPTIWFDEDPLLTAEPGVASHIVVTEVKIDVGDCVVETAVASGSTSVYTEVTVTGTHQVHRLKLAPHVAAHPAFASYGDELTLSEVSTGAAAICSPTDAPSS